MSCVITLRGKEYFGGDPFPLLNRLLNVRTRGFADPVRGTLPSTKCKADIQQGWWIKRESQLVRRKSENLRRRADLCFEILSSSVLLPHCIHILWREWGRLAEAHCQLSRGKWTELLWALKRKTHLQCVGLPKQFMMGWHLSSGPRNFPVKTRPNSIKLKRSWVDLQSIKLVLMKVEETSSFSKGNSKLR